MTNTPTPEEREVVSQLLGRLLLGGRQDVAHSLADLMQTVESYGMMTGVPAGGVPGWPAAVHWARQLHDLRIPRNGDLVRVQHPDGDITGEWEFDAQTRVPYVLRDDTGERDYRAADQDAVVTVTRLLSYRSEMPERRREAALVLRSSWTPAGTDVDLVSDDPRCGGCESQPGTKALICTHDPRNCACVPCTGARYEQPSRCKCGQPTRFRVVAWHAVPQHPMQVGAEVAEGAHLPELFTADEITSGYVCSTPCAHAYIWTVEERLIDNMTAHDRGRVRFRMDQWSYEPGEHDLPRTLHAARRAAQRLARDLGNVARAYTGKTSAEARLGKWALDSGRTALAEVLDNLVDVEPNPGGELYPPSAVDLDVDNAGEVADELAQRLEAEPGRYEHGATVVFDRVDGVYLCPRCVEAHEVVPESIDCSSCGTRLVTPSWESTS